MNIGMGSKKSSDSSTEKPTGSKLWKLHYLHYAPDPVFSQVIDYIERTCYLMTIYQLQHPYCSETERFCFAHRVLYPKIGHDSALEKGLEE